MAEIFNTDLPPRFQYKPGTEEELQRDIEEYLDRFSFSVDEMFKRVFNRLDVSIEDASLWEVDGTETQLKDADEVDMQTKKIINVTDPAAAQDAATKASSEAAATAESLWEVTGGVTRLKTADEIDARTQKITNIVDPTTNQGAATKKFHDDDMDAEMNTSTGHDHDGTDSKKTIATNLDMTGITNDHDLYNNSGTLAGRARVSSGMTLVSHDTFTNVATTDNFEISQGVSYMVVINYHPHINEATDGKLRFNSDDGQHYAAKTGDTLTTDSKIDLQVNALSQSVDIYQAVLFFDTVLSDKMAVHGHAIHMSGVTNVVRFDIMGAWDDSTTVTDFELVFGANQATGTVTIYELTTS